MADEEEDGTGAIWICAEHPELVRCDYLLNEGGGEALPIDSQRIFAVSMAEKGVFRFTLTTDGVAGHASLPMAADNALVSWPRCSTRWPTSGRAGTPGPRALLAGLGPGR